MNKNYDIELVDVSARDGLQNEPNAKQLSAEVKVAFIRSLAQSGLKRIEAGSFVRPQSVPSMANSAEVATLLVPVQKEFPDIVFSYLVPNLKGLERAKSVNAKEIAVFLAISEMFSHSNINMGVDESFSAIEPTVKEAIAAGMRVRGYLSNVFGYDDLPFRPCEVAKRSKQLLDMGCFEVSLGDTTAIGKPDMVDELIKEMNSLVVPMEKIAMHFHDTFGSAIGNVERSYELGIRTFDAATGGLGGCPYANSPRGNLAMEKLVSWCGEKHLSCAVSDVKYLQKSAKFIYEKLGKEDLL